MKNKKLNTKKSLSPISIGRDLKTVEDISLYLSKPAHFTDVIIVTEPPLCGRINLVELWKKMFDKDFKKGAREGCVKKKKKLE